jgi:hypothetical protein
MLAWWRPYVTDRVACISFTHVNQNLQYRMFSEVDDCTTSDCNFTMKDSKPNQVYRSFALLPAYFGWGCVVAIAFAKHRKQGK